ncbi:MAG: FAD-dependent oxidoreductase [Candidatus Methanomethyliaceae archaeon]|nr:FAD-dependent oxidoreductase [Candidatus Methanomethyliaceae archaeon]
MGIYKTEVLVIGGGLAGLTAAISSASNLSETMIVTKTLVGGANTTSVAAGIISGVMGFKDPEDSRDLHYKDTIVGGHGINDEVLVRVMVNDVSKYLYRLMELGLELDGEDEPKRRLIPGHSKPRSYLIKGKCHKLQSLLRNVCEGLGVRFMERTLITSLVKDEERVVGAVGIKTDNMEVVGIKANSVVLATGGSGELYPHTLMPSGSSGYGVSLGFRAGAELVDMEFVQFYPTMVAEEGLPKLFVDYAPLLKYGADIIDGDGRSIFKKHGIVEPHKLTRDQFSIIMAKEMSSGGAVFLDCTSIKDEDLASNLTLSSAIGDLESKNVPVRSRRVKVAPYAHFFMGGLRTDANGATNIQGLFAAGEAMGGVHGANRIGGNALAACLVFGFRAGMLASLHSSTVIEVNDKVLNDSASKIIEDINSDGGEEASRVRSIVQRNMWEGVGILRDKNGLERALSTLNSLRELKISSKSPTEKLLIPMMLDNAEVIALSAMIREESRGAHYRTDFPETRDEWCKRIVLKLQEGECKVSFLIP